MLNGYYPALLSEEEYFKLVVALNERKSKPRSAGGKTLFPSIITGLKIATCGVCGGGLVSRNQQRKPKLNGKKIDRRIICPTCEPTQTGSASMESTERAILDYCSDQMNLDSLTASVDTSSELRRERAAIAIKVADLNQRLGKMLDVALEETESLPQVMITKMREIENQIAQAKIRDEQINAELALAKPAGSTTSASAWTNLKDGVLALDYEARMKARQLVADTFRSIRVYFAGVESDGHAIDVLIESHSGAMRWLKINRKTGAMLSAVNAEVTEDSGAITKVIVETIPTKH